MFFARPVAGMSGTLRSSYAQITLQVREGGLIERSLHVRFTKKINNWGLHQKKADPLHLVYLGGLVLGGEHRLQPTPTPTPPSKIVERGGCIHQRHLSGVGLRYVYPSGFEDGRNFLIRGKRFLERPFFFDGPNRRLRELVDVFKRSRP